MSVHRVSRKDGFRYRVRWRDERAALRSRTFTRKADADAFDAKVKLAKRQGELAELDAGRMKLAQFLDDEWWPKYAEPELAGKTRAYYESVLRRLIKPELGHLQLRSITPARVSEFQAELRRRGVSDETIRKTLSILQGALERAVEWGRMTRNPVRSIKKGRRRRERHPRPVPPATVERIRQLMLARDHVRDATLVSVLAYAGLRPGEALALRWADVGAGTLGVSRAISLGEEKATKTGRSRVVRVMRPLRDDLQLWRKVSAPADDQALVFPRRDGAPWSETDYRNWRRRRFEPAAREAGMEQPTPYALRHSLASLLFHEGRNLADIAGQMGHDVQTLATTYTHVIEELRDAPRRPAEKLVRDARAAVERAASPAVAA